MWDAAPPRDTDAALQTANTRGVTCHVHFIKHDLHLLPLSLPQTVYEGLKRDCWKMAVYKLKVILSTEKFICPIFIPNFFQNVQIFLEYAV